MQRLMNVKLVVIVFGNNWGVECKGSEENMFFV